LREARSPAALEPDQQYEFEFCNNFDSERETAGMHAGRICCWKHGVKSCRVNRIRGVDIQPRSKELNS
jgi:hypothetical protein